MTNDEKLRLPFVIPSSLGVSSVVILIDSRYPIQENLTQRQQEVFNVK